MVNHYVANNLIEKYSSENILVETRELITAFILLFIVILTFSYPDIFISKSLYLDDYHRYTLGLDSVIHETIYARSTARAYIIYPLYKLLSIDMVWARLALVLFFYIPLSFSVYYLLRSYAKVAPVVAFFSSLLPCILPGQLQIPYFIDGSYTVQGLLVYVCSLIISLKFIATKEFSLVLFIGSVLSYLFSIEMMDQSIFLLPFSIISFILVSNPPEKAKRITVLSVICLLIAALKIVQILEHPTSSMSVPIEPSWELFFSRSANFAHTVLPFSYKYNASISESIIICTGFILITSYGLLNSDKKHKALVLLGVIWVFCTIIVFLTVSRYYSPRYTHIPAFGVNFVLVLSIWNIFNKSRLISTKYTLLFILLISLTIYSGTKRFLNMNRLILPQNEVHESIIHDLGKYEIPDESQIVIVEGHRIPTGGWWVYSSGFMKLSTGRADVTGIIGIEKGFYDPFGIDKRGFQYEYQMSGLVQDKPILLFRQYCAEKCELKQKKYALQWMANSWNLLEFDLTTGKKVSTKSGSSYDEYIEFIKKNDLTDDDIIFSAGEPESL